MPRKKKRRFVVSVKDFGARGDGFSNDTEAFRAAARSKAAKIVVPPGRYEIEGDVVVDHRFVYAERRLE
jgi:polygalacturonase